MQRLKNYPKILLAGLLFFACTTTASLGQINNIDELIRTGQQDAEILTRAYLKPLPSGFGGDINSGWFMNAKPHKSLGFDIQIRGAVAFVPNSDQSFDLSDLNLQRTRPEDLTNTISPTISGDDTPGPGVIIEDENGDQVGQFNLPSGSGYDVVPAPMLQASLGIIKDTDITVRFIPESSAEDIEYGMLGFGIKHGINQWLPGGNLLPVDLSLMAGYTNIDVTGDLDLRPEGFPADQEAANANYDNQEAQISLNTFTVKALVGKSLPFISVYGGVGYETSTMEVDVAGNYPVNVSTPLGEGFDLVRDPISYEEDGNNSFSLLAGTNIKLLFFNIFAEYTLTDYPILNAGVGFSFR